MIITLQSYKTLTNYCKFTQLLLNYNSSLTTAKISNRLVTQINANLSSCSSLIHRNSYSFVKLPITSKYYNNQLPSSLDAALILAEKESKLNEKCFLIEHIVELIERDPKLKSSKVDTFLKKELRKWREDNMNGTQQSTGRFQRIMTIAWIIKKMGYQDN